MEVGNPTGRFRFHGCQGGRENGDWHAVKRFSLICAALVVFAGSLGAQQRITDADVPTLPANGFSDEGGVLGTEPAAAQRIIGLIRELREMYGYRLFLIIESSLISTNPSDLAARLQQEWLPEGGGLVLVYESDTRQMGFGRSLESADGVVENDAGVPSYELVAIVSEALEGLEGSETAEVHLETIITGISTGLGGYFERKQAPIDGSRSLKLALVTIGALSLLALCGMGLGWLMGKADKRQSEKRVFPPLEVPERLSAPYGGGGGGYGSFGNGGPRN